MTYRVGSLFSGYGGLDIALSNVIDTELSWVCDNDTTVSRILRHHHPNTPNLGDITQTDWHTVAPADIITAGFPCQDISNAGNRAGIEGKRSGLWTHIIDACRVLGPRLLVLENVAAITTRGLDTIAGGLAEIGFDAEWTCLRASDIGAPHHRNRWFAIAWPYGSSHPHDIRRERRRETRDRIGGPSYRDRGPIEWWGRYAGSIHQWENTLGRYAPAPTDDRGRLDPKFVEWMMGLPDSHVTGVPGISRSAMLRSLGNGVVPQQATAAIRHLIKIGSTP